MAQTFPGLLEILQVANNNEANICIVPLKRLEHCPRAFPVISLGQGEPAKDRSKSHGAKAWAMIHFPLPRSHI